MLAARTGTQNVQPPAGAIAALLPGNRLHLQHGPIDLIIKAWGEDLTVTLAYRRAEFHFRSILQDLVAELAQLRDRVDPHKPPGGETAQRMWQATRVYSAQFITPMAAVAGSVADEILSVLKTREGLSKCYVNNGGDIALFLQPHETLRIGLMPESMKSSYANKIPAMATIAAADNIGGVATSGWQGRSHSLGIADAVTVLAGCAAAADAAATLIANAVTLDSPAVRRVCASNVDIDSDLGQHKVTVAVATLTDAERGQALQAGAHYAEKYMKSGLIKAAYIYLQGGVIVIGSASALNNAHARLVQSI